MSSGLFKCSLLRLLLATPKLLERSVIASNVFMCLLQNHKFFEQSSRFLENSLYKGNQSYINVSSSYSNFSH